MTVSPADHRYLQVARTLRKEIVDGVYPVGSQLPTEHELCERFAVSRYTVREALRRLRDDNLVSSRPRAGTMVVPRVVGELLCAGQHVDQRPAGLRQRGRTRHRVNPDGHHRRRTRRAHRTARGRGVARRARLPPGRRRRVHALLDRVLHQPGVRRGRHGCCSATPARSSRSSRTCSASASSRCTRRSAPCWSTPEARRRLKVDAGTRRRSRCTARTRPPTVRSPRSPSTPIPRPGSGTR